MSYLQPSHLSVRTFSTPTSLPVYALAHPPFHLRAQVIYGRFLFFKFLMHCKLVLHRYN
jgi:hypothetical protein